MIYIAQLILVSGILANYWMFSQDYLRLHFFAMANFLSAAFIINTALLRNKSFTLALLSASILVVGFFFSAQFISGRAEFLWYGVFLVPGVLVVAHSWREGS